MKKQTTLTEAAPNWQPSSEQLARHHNRVVNHTKSAATPLPGPLREAFATAPQHIHIGQTTLTLIPITAGHIALLQQINSPFLQAVRLAALIHSEDKQISKAAKKEAAKITNTIEDTAETLYIFTHHPRDTRALIARTRQTLREKVLETIIDTAPPNTDWNQIAATLGQHFALSFATAVQYEPEQTEDAGRNFTQPAPSVTD
jgi:hypothetical protein